MNAQRGRPARHVESTTSGLSSDSRCTERCRAYPALPLGSRPCSLFSPCSRRPAPGSAPAIRRAHTRARPAMARHGPPGPRPEGSGRPARRSAILEREFGDGDVVVCARSRRSAGAGDRDSAWHRCGVGVGGDRDLVVVADDRRLGAFGTGRSSRGTGRARGASEPPHVRRRAGEAYPLATARLLPGAWGSGAWPR